jgi:hypothetical protein
MPRAPKRSGGPKPEARAERAIRNFHVLGQKALQLRKEQEDKPFRQVLRELAEAERTHYDRAKKAARFAELYDESSLVELSRARVNGRPLSLNHVRRLIMVRLKADRASLLKRVVKEGWTAERLGREIAKRRAEPRKGGPRLRGPRSLDEGLDQIARWTTDWLKHYEGNWVGKAAWLKPPRRGAVSDKRKERIKEVRALVQRLKKEASVLDERLGTLDGSG